MKNNVIAIAKRGFTLAAVGVFLLLAWIAAVKVFQPPVWLFPGPQQVWQRFVELIAQNALQPHISVTLIEVCFGYVIGVALGTLSGYPIAKFRPLEKFVSPYFIAANSIPLVAFAPLLLLWFGTGIPTKIVVAALIVYFPMTISTWTGFQQQSTQHLRLMKSLKVGKWQKFVFLELPSALPGILAGMKIASPLAVVGAVVGEFLGTGQGLGHLILEANGLLDTPMLFVAIIVLAFVGMVFYSMVLALERALIGPWHQKRRNS